HMEGERMERLGEVISWFCEEEGYTFAAFGIEGEHWNRNADGVPVHADHMRSPTNATGVRLGDLGFFFGISSHKERNYYYYPMVKELEEAVADSGKYLWHPQLSLLFNDEETRTMADVQTAIRDTAGEYCARFVVGQLDPNNDAHWEEYLNTLNRMGNVQFEEIRTEAFWRGTNQHIIDAYNITR
ncbi:MAG: hypothetical protein FWH01_10030, partial [Oscillospiraceae bacterium]|nr:hypothetical protein [Oscillospiraceae bacterium]